MKQEWLGFAHELANEANAMLSAAMFSRPQESVKADKSFVTALDGEIELLLRDMIAKKYPTHGILGEEHGSIGLERDLIWVLDPIDGTAPFIAGVPVFGTLISLLEQGKPLLGLIDLPATQERFEGMRGQETRHKRGSASSAMIKTRACASLSNAILTTSNPDFYAPHERPALESLKSKTAWRIYGGCCMAYGLLASGRTDVAIDTGFKIYDYAPFVPIIEGAGGKITDWQGNALHLNSGSQILSAGQAARHSEALALVQEALT